MEKTDIAKFGKDHWSLLGYVETRCVDGREGAGELDRRRLRCNPDRHPMLVGAYSPEGLWKPAHSTRLAGFFAFEGRHDVALAAAAGVQIRDHDDWDCLDDLDAAGLVEILSLANGFVRMTAAGTAMAARLRAHKSSGGSSATFSPEKADAP